jgi:opacity protein-like surface antigen
VKTINHSVIGAAFCLFAANAAATDWTHNMYLKGDVGGAFRPNTIIHESFGNTAYTTYKAGIRADIALGYDISDSWALELSTGIIWNSMDKVNGVPLNAYDETFDTYIIPNLVNVIYKVPTKSSWSPYVAVGIGSVVSIADINAGNYHGRNPDLSDSDFTFAYQAEAGVKYSLTKNVSVSIDYKFLGTLAQSWYMRSFSNHLETDAIYTHAVLVNLCWKF